jgi:hypothetical protein
VGTLLTRPSRTVHISITLVGLVLTILIWLSLRSLSDTMTQSGGAGIVDFELAFTSERAGEIISSWNPTSLQAVRQSLLLDYAFMPAYAMAFGGITLLVARAQQRPTLRKVGLWLALGCAAAAVLDALENLMLLLILGTQPIPPVAPLIAGTSASIKFLLLLLALLYWLTGGTAGSLAEYAQLTARRVILAAMVRGPNRTEANVEI